MSIVAFTQALARVALILASAAAAAGCATVTKVELAEVRDVFSDRSQLATGNGVPPEASKTAVYDVPFEDVFRLTNLSASQAQLSVEDVQKNAGIILATRSVMKDPSGMGSAPTPHRFFYAVSVQELAPKSTRVRVVAKMQGKCQTSTESVPGGSAMYAFVTVSTLGLGHMALAPLDKRCKELRQPHWATDKDSAEQELSQFFIFLRNNLLAARLL